MDKNQMLAALLMGLGGQSPVSMPGVPGKNINGLPPVEMPMTHGNPINGMNPVPMPGAPNSIDEATLQREQMMRAWEQMQRMGQ